MTKLDSKIIEDASESNWVDRFCPLWSKPFLKLSRIDRPIGTWLLFIPCCWGLGLGLISTGSKINLSDFWLIMGCLIGSVLMRGAGCTWNDINDQKFDASVYRTQSRPIPSGQVTNKQAVLWMLIQTTISFLILITFNKLAVIIGIVSLIPVIIYPFAKRFTWWPQVFLGIAFNWGSLLTYAGHTERIDLAIISLYLAGIFWTLFYDTIYAHQDTEDDALVGIKSTALLFAEKTKFWLFGFIIFCALNMTYAFYLAGGTTYSQSKMIPFASVILFLLHMIKQLWFLNIRNNLNCLKTFKSNRNAGFIIIVGLFSYPILTYINP